MESTSTMLQDLLDLKLKMAETKRTLMENRVYSVMYNPEMNKFVLCPSWATVPTEYTPILMQTPDDTSAELFTEILNATVSSQGRKLFAVGLQSFYTSCIESSLEND